MKTLIDRLWREPALFLAVVAASFQACVALPDWRAALAQAAVCLAAGAGTRQLVTPRR